MTCVLKACARKAALAAVGTIIAWQAAWAAEGNPTRGQRVFGACVACHSLEADKNMTGPSLSGLWARKAGGLPSFTRYSDALKSSGVVWDSKTLDEWITDPQHLIPGNQMTFPGLKSSQQRADLLAYLQEATQPDRVPANAQRGGQMGMMGGAGVPNLKKLDSEDRVQTISYCQDNYRVTTADGKTHVFWERNLRLKTDGSADGPEKGAPALVGAGMMGDRADVIFAAPEEISALIVPKC
jgi:cytochrome c